MRFKQGDYFYTETGDVYKLVKFNDFGEFVLSRVCSWLSFNRFKEGDNKTNYYDNLDEIPPYLRKECSNYLCSYGELFEFDKVQRIQNIPVIAQDSATLYMGQLEVAFRREFLIEKDHYGLL